ncbi:glycosyltransferase family 2 protein [Paenibacillus sp. CAU 1523]|uniref:Glycosyltransferase family 2 protein n=2 Tax=Paenibacillus arenosi TaxID=2774142 RepID=A0ABR9B771_9BACL|nr:glycosyltransferase family 2 protein [Paenibacillus arenosi]
MTVSGWGFSLMDTLVDIQIKSESEKTCIINRAERADVEQAYDLDKGVKKGFHLEYKLDKNDANIIIEFKDGLCKHTHIINLKEIEREKKRNLRKKYVRFIRSIRVRNVINGMRMMKKHGFSFFYSTLKSKITFEQSAISYHNWYLHHRASADELDQQKNKGFNYEPLVSIVVPTFNTPKSFLIEMIESVRQQTYSHWELCIADGDSKSVEVKDLLQHYAKLDSRIKVKFLNENKGISGNSNEALSLATGKYIGLFDHDDLLTPDALYEVVKSINENNRPDFIYSDEDKIDEKGHEYFDPHFKPDWSPDTLRSYNYICHFTVFSKKLLDKVGVFNSDFDGSQDYDLILRLTEQAEGIIHIPKILYHWRSHLNSTASNVSAKTYTMDAAKKALYAHLERVGLAGTVQDNTLVTSYRTQYELTGTPKVSILIPNKDQYETLKICIDSILRETTYKNYEIIIIENNSTTPEIFDYYKSLEGNEQIKIVTWKDGFNYSAINNFGAKYASGEHFVLLNNDIEIITPRWIEEMLMYVQRSDVGIAGAKLYYPDNSIQHAGVIIGLGGVAGHSHKYFPREVDGFKGRLKIVQNLSAVTAACLMVRKEVFEQVEGLDERFKVAFNDVDFCLKVRAMGYQVIFTPFAEMYHHESISRGAEDTPEKIERFKGEIALFHKKWGGYVDPFYSPNLTLDREDFSYK